MSPAEEAEMKASMTGLDLPTPSTGPSMSPNTLPSDTFHDTSLASLPEADDARPPPAGGGGGALAAPGASEAEQIVGETVRALAEDGSPRLVLAESCGFSAGIVADHVVPLLAHTRETFEVVLVDLHDTETVAAVCGALYRNPTINSLVLVNSGRSQGLSREAIKHIASLVWSCGHLEALSLMNTLYAHVADAMEMIGEAVRRSRSLRMINLEANNIDDDAVLPLAQGLAGQRSILEAYLDSNSLSHTGLEILSEVMMYNESLQVLSVNKNLVRCPTDLWEGHFIWEQCQVNRQMALLGPYMALRHSEWPLLWQRKMQRMWKTHFGLVLKAKKAPEAGKAAEGGGAARKAPPAPSVADWERVLQCMDPRGYVERHVKLWMKLDPPRPDAPQLWRHT